MTISTVPNFGDRLDQAIAQTNSVVCVGLDPRVEQLPPSIKPAETEDWLAVSLAYETFCCGIIDAVQDHVGVVKPQAAFFEELGPHGMLALGRVIQYASSRGMLVILDGKRNDIGSTAKAYANAYLGSKSAWNCDALTVSPYLGRDSIEPFAFRCDESASGIFVLVKTSNPGGGYVQDKVADSLPIYRYVADLISTLNQSRLGTSGYGPIGAVVGATYPDQLSELRMAMPSAPILIPGFGAQGGSAADVAAGFDRNGRGAIVNNSRHILFAYERPEFHEKFGPEKWQDAATAAVIEMNQQLNEVRSYRTIGPRFIQKTGEIGT